MSGFLDKAPIEIPCPGCGRKVKKTVGWIQTHSDYACPGCGTPIHLDASQFRREMRKVDRSLDDFKRTIDRLNRH